MNFKLGLVALLALAALTASSPIIPTPGFSSDASLPAGGYSPAFPGGASHSYVPPESSPTPAFDQTGLEKSSETEVGEQADDSQVIPVTSVELRGDLATYAARQRIVDGNDGGDLLGVVRGTFRNERVGGGGDGNSSVFVSEMVVGGIGAMGNLSAEAPSYNATSKALLSSSNNSTWPILSSNYTTDSCITSGGNTGNATGANATACRPAGEPVRDKDIRVSQIKEYFRRIFHMGSRSQEETTQTNKFYGLSKRYPTCGAPPSIDADAWNSPKNVPMFFDMPTSSNGKQPGHKTEDNSSEGSNAETRGRINNNRLQESLVEESVISAIVGTHKGNAKRRNRSRHPSPIISAKLRLFKIGRGEGADASSAMPVEPPSSTCDEPSDDSPTRTILGNVRDFDPTIEKIRVEVYWYTAAVRKNHYKKKLLDSKMLIMKESKWVEFDIKKAVVAWIEKGQNFGLVIQVENEDGDALDASKFFSTLPCVQQGRNASTERPSLGSILPAPVLEICSLTAPSLNAVLRSDPASSNTRTPGRHHHRLLNTDVDLLLPAGHRRRHPHGSVPSYIKNPFNLQQQNQKQQPHRHQSVHNQHIRDLPSVIMTNGSNGADIDNSTNPQVVYTGSEITAIQADQRQPSLEESSTTDFSLQKNHPLREILATVASGNERNHSTESTHSSRLGDSWEYDYNDDVSGNADDLRDTVIQTVPMSELTSRYRAHHHHRPALPSKVIISITSSDNSKEQGGSSETEVVQIQNQQNQDR